MVTITGRVVNSATQQLLDPTKTVVMGFIISNYGGNPFSITGILPGVYDIYVTYFGFKTFWLKDYDMTVDTTYDLGTIALIPESGNGINFLSMWLWILGISVVGGYLGYRWLKKRRR